MTVPSFWSFFVRFDSEISPVLAALA